MMSGIVELDKIRFDELVGVTNFKDDVFSGPQQPNQVGDLSAQFQLMQTAENNVPSAVTDLVFNHLPSNCKPVTTDASLLLMGEHVKDASDRAKKQLVTECTQPNDGKQIFNINDSRCGLLAGVASFASKTISETLADGMKESSMYSIFSNFRVPRIIINSASDDQHQLEDEVDRSEIKPSEKNDLKMCGTYSGFKCEEKHRSKNYYMPYCLINRRHYTCGSYNHRSRKYGVSQRRSYAPGMKELTQLLDEMVTGDQPCQNGNSRKKWQYSPPPKFYTIRYRPPTMLADIKERSRSLNDLSLQSLKINSSSSSPTQYNVGSIKNEGTKPCTLFQCATSKITKCLYEDDFKTLKESTKATTVDSVVSRLNNLNMEEKY